MFICMLFRAPGPLSHGAPTPVRIGTPNSSASSPLPRQVPSGSPFSSTMAFSELMDRVGSKGTFQYLNMVLLGLPVLGLANHYLLQIFTAATPPHHCRLPPNASAGPWGLPKGLDGKPETCLRFIYPPNTSLPNNTQGATEPCLDGWVYDLHTVDSIVTEVRTEGALLPPLARGRDNSLGSSLPGAGTGGRVAGQAERKDLGADADEPESSVSSRSESPAHF